MQILLLDNFDSFSYNLVDLLLQEGHDISVVRNDVWEPDTVKADAVVLSPGPCTPGENGRLMEAVAYYNNRVPVLGVCLGHQALGEYYGAQLVKATTPVHGKTSRLLLQQTSSLFSGIDNYSQVMRYHSLVLKDLPDSLLITATDDSGLVMAFEHRHLPVYGVQFHPESILSVCGKQIIRNFVAIAQGSR